MNIIPQLYERFSVLVPNPKVCFNAENDYDSRVWTDPRPEPTLEQVLAVTQAQLDLNMLNPESNTFDTKKYQRLLFEINFDQENRKRVLEKSAGQANKNQITKKQYLDALVTLWKTLP